MPDVSPNRNVAPPSERLPNHIAIIMDGNGRWAKQQHKPRVFGHKAGVETVRVVMRACAEKGIGALTLFAFSTENWNRPKKEVGMLMDLFITSLANEVEELHKNNIRIQFIGERSAFSEKLRKQIEVAEKLTAENDKLVLTIAANYGGRWDITQAAMQVAQKLSSGEITTDDISPETIGSCISTHSLPDPDLFIRTGGEHRISNFLLWQLAYTELYFTDTLWPDFDEQEFEQALLSFTGRQRRFGRTGEQVEQKGV